MVEPKSSAGSRPGTNPNQFAQVGMGGSLGGGQFEQGEGQSGSLQPGGGGTTPDQAAISTQTELTPREQENADGTPMRQQEQDEESGRRSSGGMDTDRTRSESDWNSSNS